MSKVFSRNVLRLEDIAARWARLDPDMRQVATHPPAKGHD
ncbi:hypothetical protein HNR40_010306 [Nonomuraea endophytica]|uniref:Uncharacterized protein n=1 Tax=Nonomuraea endophytica TaxID=714136 RepID=A0A7W8AES7_9ACTN|nr:hypothetical protein [Nonomuraea endophytica]